MHSRLEQGGYEYRDEDWEGLVQEYMHDIHYTTMLEAGVNFVHAMIGPAVVALPFAVLQVRLMLFVFASARFQTATCSRLGWVSMHFYCYFLR